MIMTPHITRAGGDIAERNVSLQIYYFRSCEPPPATPRPFFAKRRTRPEARFAAAHLDELTMVEIEAGASGVKRLEDLEGLVMGL